MKEVPLTMKHKKLNFEKFESPLLVATALKFKQSGQLAVSPNRLTYLNINDHYIHQLFPLLPNEKNKIVKPDYFGENSIGAHISVIYPEENTMVSDEDIGIEHYFKIIGTFTADLNLKRYYVLKIESDSLHHLRKKYNLPEKLLFKEHLVDFHITIGVSFLLA